MKYMFGTENGGGGVSFTVTDARVVRKLTGYFSVSHTGSRTENCSGMTAVNKKR